MCSSNTWNCSALNHFTHAEGFNDIYTSCLLFFVVAVSFRTADDQWMMSYKVRENSHTHLKLKRWDPVWCEPFTLSVTQLERADLLATSALLENLKWLCGTRLIFSRWMIRSGESELHVLTIRQSSLSVSTGCWKSCWPCYEKLQTGIYL